MNRLVAIVGPTGVSKSEQALKLAREFHGEIVGADSRQVYRYMDIGTAKPDCHERGMVRHHLIDIISPDEAFSLAQYQEMAYRTIDDIFNRGRLPFLVGGSGLHVWAVLEGWQIPRVAPDLDFRQSLQNRAARGDKEALYVELKHIDPAAASRIDPHNVRRIIRALEIRQGQDADLSRTMVKKLPPFKSLVIGLTAGRAELYRRIDERVDEMIARGLVEEVRKMVAMSYGWELPSMSSIGYRQIGFYLKGEITLDEAIRLIKTESHRLVRHQYNWFKPKDDRIRWFDVALEPYSQLKALVAAFIKP